MTENVERETRVGYVGKRISKKQAKMMLFGVPKHGPVKRELMKYYMGLRQTAPEQIPEKRKV